MVADGHLEKKSNTDRVMPKSKVLDADLERIKKEKKEKRAAERAKNRARLEQYAAARLAGPTAADRALMTQEAIGEWKCWWGDVFQVFNLS